MDIILSVGLNACLLPCCEALRFSIDRTVKTGLFDLSVF
uniref:Uncharacterized protein n=1 Tax=Anguilla anguilla TaxID=7936 RepID=A0A0E9QJJ9_ANGAN